MSALPLVRMCDRPRCRGWKTCCRDRRRTMTYVNWMAPAVIRAYGDQIARVLQQDLILSCCVTDSAGVRHVVPDGAEFIVHKGHARIRRPAGVSSDHECYGAVYASLPAGGLARRVAAVLPSWPLFRRIQSIDLDLLLADVPQWSEDYCSERLDLLRVA